ncbi:MULTISPECIES: DUF3500 domain-containing protein [Agrobacterium]|uniref:DUF3500 domain-containing protein n=1 Tax=Agrobacterium rubi TaxID=28099 RepID=A0AAE7R7P5_9HYPH|nr:MULTISPECIES: DUF3500 domain-containing protein [Agrobacterium]MBN7807869.1 DUF3500 domain-containing protein [Agrobacterium rosae]NTE89829.1 DUF3500 domain-containing protein [Agrobacterium rubi]NTF05321.1 DUF3500 domain-containing protein [Agrobacterium rubi]NTF39765.1 DUF3500 domain-containing protein [Agrobacterium rubi]OCJ44922.1 hypothetical protein A6U92_17015 [Agrobacterium rubi]
MLTRSTIYISLCIGLLANTANSAIARDASAMLNHDGSVTVTGITQPGQDIKVSQSCLAQTNQAAMVACTANKFLETLSDKQEAKVLLDLTKENSTAWSNLPCGSRCRVGISLGDLSTEQVAAALAVVKAASSANVNDGFSEMMQILMADDVLGAAQSSEKGYRQAGTPPRGKGPRPDGPPPNAGPPPRGAGFGGYSSANYFIAFLGTPGTRNTWQLQFGGHHLALLKTYTADREVGDTPTFVGIEPKVWTDGENVHAPLEQKRQAMVAMLAGLTTTQLAAAKIDAAFSDVLLGPGADGKFPETKVGLPVAELDVSQKQLVLAAMNGWVRDTAPDTADTTMTDYKAGLDQTYIAYSGNRMLSNHADYVRIDGPRVWIEFVCQDGVVYGNQIHYHTVWRDHETDYGAVYRF